MRTARDFAHGMSAAPAAERADKLQSGRWHK